MKVDHRAISSAVAASARYMSALTVGMRLFLVCVFVMSIAGCRQKELWIAEEEMGIVDVRFIWDNADGADPAGMTLLFYPLETRGSFWRYDIPGSAGGRVEIAPGSYTMIAVNNDLRNVRLADMSYINSVAAVARTIGTGVVEPTGMLYEGIVSRIIVPPAGITHAGGDGHSGYSPDIVVECAPDSVASVCRIRLVETDGLERIRAIDAAIEGCSGALMLGTGQPSAEAVNVAFPMRIAAEEMMAEGVTSGFMRHDSGAGYTLTLRASYFNGRLYEKKINVTDDILNYPHPHNVFILIKGLVFPENPSHTEGDESLGIDVDIDGWHLIEINIDTATN